MIKQVLIGKLMLLVDKNYSLQQLYDQLNDFGSQAKLLFLEQQTGAGYFQWAVPGDDWKPFAEYDDATKPVIAEIFEKRRAVVKASLEGFPLRDAVLTVPSESEYVFFRQKDGDWEIAVAAWGYKYVNIPEGSEIATWVVEKEYQEVNLGFLWNGKLLPDMPFFLEEMHRITDSDGNFHIEPLEVGRKLSLRTSDGHQFSLVVEKGRADYRFDLTQFQKVEVKVTKDGQAVSGQSCDLSFGGTNIHLETDETGMASADIPLTCNPDGSVPTPQPECIATCQSETQQQTPSANGETMHFNFDFKTPVVEPEPEPQPEPKYVTIRLADYGGYPMPGLSFKLTTKKMGEKELETDENGCCQVPQEWFTDKEKMRIKVSISPEYQDAHDLHKNHKKKK